MEFENTGGFLGFASEIVKVGEQVLSQGITEGWMKTDRSYATHTDVFIDRSITSLTRDALPGVPIISEELRPNIPSDQVFISIDSLDGTTNYSAGLRDWSISWSIICEGEPVGAVVVQPPLRRAFATLSGGGIQEYLYDKKKWINFRRRPGRKPTLGMDVGPHSPPEYMDEVSRIVRRSNLRPINSPAVAAGIEVLVGSLFGWWSHTAHHWDMAAISLLIEGVGGVTQCLDGSPVPWTRGTKLPPLLIADSQEWADRIRLLIASPEANRTRLTSG